jgi:hypothetical protein
VRWSFENPNPSGLRFSSPQDALYVARQIAQDAKNWHTAKNWNPAKSYTKGHINVVLTGRIAGHLGNYDLVFSAIPDNARSAKYAGKRRIGIIIPDKLNLSYINSRLDDGAMFVCISEFVQGPQGRIPSSVRLEPHKKRLDFWRDMLGFTFEVASKFRLRVPERESSSLFEVSCNDRAGRVIQGRSQVLNRRNRTLRNRAGHPLSEADFVNVMRSLGIKLSDSLVYIQRKKKAGQFFQLTNVMLCPSDTFNSGLKLWRNT